MGCGVGSLQFSCLGSLLGQNPPTTPFHDMPLAKRAIVSAPEAIMVQGCLLLWCLQVRRLWPFANSLSTYCQDCGIVYELSLACNTP